jgi:hypothetical protein
MDSSRRVRRFKKHIEDVIKCIDPTGRVGNCTDSAELVINITKSAEAVREIHKIHRIRDKVYRDCRMCEMVCCSESKGTSQCSVGSFSFIFIFVNISLCLFLQLYFQSGTSANPTSSPMNTEVPFPRTKRQGREADHAPPSNAEIKKTWINTSTPPAFVFN